MKSVALLLSSAVLIGAAPAPAPVPSEPIAQLRAIIAPVSGADLKPSMKSW